MALSRVPPGCLLHSRKRLLLRRKLLAGFVTVCISVVICRPQAQAPVVGQNSGTTRSIEGKVINAQGNTIPSAVVLLKDTKSLQVRSYIAQADGRYHFDGLSTDINYQLRAEANGYTSKVKTVSVFDSHRIVKLNLKIANKKLRS